MSDRDGLAIFAASQLRFRRGRVIDLPEELFSEPAWDLLLELFVADAKSYKITGRDVCERCGISITVMSRWLQHLTKVGLLVGDGTGNIDDELTLSAVGLHQMERTLGRAAEAEGTLIA